jgi:hypothetical protein
MDLQEQWGQTFDSRFVTAWFSFEPVARQLLVWCERIAESKALTRALFYLL